MGLKTDIENAFLKNIKVDKDPDYEVSAEGQEKVSELAQDLSDAIVNWVTKQEFRVDKLSAPVFIPIGTFINGGAPIPAAAHQEPIDCSRNSDNTCWYGRPLLIQLLMWM